MYLFCHMYTVCITIVHVIGTNTSITFIWSFHCSAYRTPIDISMRLMHVLNHYFFPICTIHTLSTQRCNITRRPKASPIVKFMGPIWSPPGYVGPRWARCWPHELGYDISILRPEWNGPTLQMIKVMHYTGDKPLLGQWWPSSMTHTYATLQLLIHAPVSIKSLSVKGTLVIFHIHLRTPTFLSCFCY